MKELISWGARAESIVQQLMVTTLLTDSFF